MTWLSRIFARLSSGREAPAASTAPAPEAWPAPGVYTPGQVAEGSAGIPVAAVGDPVPVQPAALSIPPAAIALLHHYESCARRLPSGLIAPYLDAAGVPTIGWGNTRWEGGMAVSMTDAPIPQDRADRLFAQVLAGFDTQVRGFLPANCPEEVHAAMLSFAYNVGVAAARGSSAAKALAAGNVVRAAGALELWNKAGGKVLKGLRRRRRAEGLVMLGATVESAIAAALRDYP